MKPLAIAYFAAVIGALFMTANSFSADDDLHLKLRSRTKSGALAAVEKQADWNPRETALIICDMWDDHWCKSAARRVAEMAGPLNDVVKQARARGVFIIHAPSSVTDFYKDTPQRKRAQAAPFAPTPVPLATSPRWGTAWCWPDSKHEGVLPIDDSDMGCSCSGTIATIELAPEDALTCWRIAKGRPSTHMFKCTESRRSISRKTRGKPLRSARTPLPLHRLLRATNFAWVKPCAIMSLVWISADRV